MLPFYTLTLSILTAYIDHNFFSVSTILLIPIISLTFSLCQKIPITLSMTAITIAFAFSYIFFSFSSVITCGLFWFFFDNYNHAICQFVCGIFQILLMQLPFLRKRLTKGMPFLRKRFYSITGTIISVMVLFLAILFNNNNYNHLFIIPCIALYFFAILIYLYWKSNLTKTYLDKLREKDLSDLNTQLAAQQKQIAALKQENQRLAKIIHKDNKLIPAMEYSVKRYLSTTKNNSVDFKTEGNNLLIELSKISDERKNIIQYQEQDNLQLPSTNITSTDSLLHYMKERAQQDDITLQIIIHCELPYLVQHIIDETDFNTLLADLIENALIATKYNNQHAILISFGIINKAYSINIFDSGIPFTSDVLLAFGKQQITTHANDTGSGIGLMTAYALLQKYNASFIIHEFNSESKQYTKEISILFNNLQQYILKTSRTEKELALLRKRSDLQIVQT